MNVTEDQMKKYIKTFHETFLNAANEHLPEEAIKLLQRYQWIQGKTIGYISTNFGAGYEYKFFEPTKLESENIEIVRSSSRIEDLFLNLDYKEKKFSPHKIIIGGENIKMSGRLNFVISGTNIKNGGVNFVADLPGYPFRFGKQDASIAFINMEFTIPSLGWSRYIEYAELHGNRTESYWSEKNATRRAMNEIIIAVKDIDKAKEFNTDIVEFVKDKKQKTVLLLGSFKKDGNDRLGKIKIVLKKLGYNPVRVDDYDDIEVQSLSEKVSMIASFSRFIVMDDTSPSGHLTEIEIIKKNDLLTIMLQLKGKISSYMAKGSSINHLNIKEVEYTMDTIHETLETSIKWVEERIDTLKIEHNNIYPWR